MTTQDAQPAPETQGAATDWTDRAKQEYDEYNEWVAILPIYAGTALAYNVGHPVPKSNVKLHGYDADGLVARRTSKAGRAALGEKE